MIFSLCKEWKLHKICNILLENHCYVCSKHYSYTLIRLGSTKFFISLRRLSMGIVEGLSMGVVDGLRSEMKNFEDPRGMRVYTFFEVACTNTFTMFSRVFNNIDERVWVYVSSRISKLVLS